MSLAEAGVSDLAATDAEGEPVLGGRLLRLGLGAGLDDLGDGPGRLGGAEADLLELADRQVVEVTSLWSSRPPDRVDDLGGADVAIDLEVPGDLRGGVGLADVGHAAQLASSAAVSSGSQPGTNRARKASASSWVEAAERAGGLGLRAERDPDRPGRRGQRAAQKITTIELGP